MNKTLFTFVFFLLCGVVNAQSPYYFYNQKGEKENLLLQTGYAFLSLNDPIIPNQIKQPGITYTELQPENKKYPTNNGKCRFGTVLHFEKKQSEKQYIEFLLSVCNSKISCTFAPLINKKLK